MRTKNEKYIYEKSNDDFGKSHNENSFLKKMNLTNLKKSTYNRSIYINNIYIFAIDINIIYNERKDFIIT